MIMGRTKQVSDKPLWVIAIDDQHGPRYVSAITGAEPETDARWARKFSLPADAEAHLAANREKYEGKSIGVVEFKGPPPA